MCAGMRADSDPVNVSDDERTLLEESFAMRLATLFADDPEKCQSSRLFQSAEWPTKTSGASVDQLTNTIVGSNIRRAVR